MPLVDYPESDESDKPIGTQGNKRKRTSPPTGSPSKNGRPSTLPPLPSTFLDLYATSTRLSSRDDPSLHGGRQRQTPHIEGHWPTHVYIECIYHSLLQSPPLDPTIPFLCHIEEPFPKSAE